MSATPTTRSRRVRPATVSRRRAARALRTAAQRDERPSVQSLVALPSPGRTRAGTLRRALVLADACGLLLAFVLVQLFVSKFQPDDLRISAVFLGGLAAWLLFAHAYGFYEPDEIGVSRSVVDDLPGILVVSTLATWLGLVFVNSVGLASSCTSRPRSGSGRSSRSPSCGRFRARSSTGDSLRAADADRGHRPRRAADRRQAGLPPRIRPRGDRLPGGRSARAACGAPPHLGGLKRLEQVVRAYGSSV